MADLLFAVVFMGGFLMLYYGISKHRPYLSCTAGLVFGVASLVKPVLFCWPIFSLAIWFLFVRASGRPGKWKHVSVFFLLQLVMLVGWSTRNYVAEDYFTFSIVDSKTAREYLAPQVEEWARAGHAPSADAIKRNAENARMRDRIDSLQNRQTLGDNARRQRSESLAIFQKYPMITVRAYIKNI
jgi:4-amino-4-deoxy-L-arabinose transferase-like glycosyltransferase